MKLLKTIQKLMLEQPIVIIFSGLVIVILLIFIISTQIGNTYEQYIKIPEYQEIQKDKKVELRIRRVRIIRGDGDDRVCTEINHNGLFRKYNCNTLATIDQGYLSFDQVESLFSIITGNFDGFEGNFIGGDTSYAITIETTQGTKTINIESGEGELPSVIEEFIKEVEEQEGETFFPTPIPEASPTFTPTPSAFPTITPSPSTSSPTPAYSSPTPLPPGVTPEPFSCDMLDTHERSITVSNIVCLP